MQMFRDRGKIDFSRTRPSSVYLWPILNRFMLSLNDFKLAELVLRLFSIESPKSHKNLHVNLGILLFSVLTTPCPAISRKQKIAIG